MSTFELIRKIAEKVGIKYESVSNTINLLNDGSTIPFISRYRKEYTGGLDEVQIQSIKSEYDTLNGFVKRRDFILNSIKDQGKLTPELENKIIACWNLVDLEDIYLPFKPKRKTRAEVARANGLEPLAKIIMSQHGDNIDYRAEKFINKMVISINDAIKGAMDIIAEWISENAIVRNRIRSIYYRSSMIVSKVIKGKEIEGEKYANYFDTNELLKKCSSHRLLAMLRGESEGILRLQLKINDKEAIDNIKRFIVKGNTQSSQIVELVVEDSYKRLIKPSIEAETIKAAKEVADKVAIDTFAQNLRQLLFAPPLGKKRVLGIDPGFRTGCKIVCLDEQGNLLHNDVIYPNAPKYDVKGASSCINYLVDAYKIDAISVGNGTASRETEQFLSKIIINKDVDVFIVNESGASIYSASKIARDEFPDKDVTVRGAVSIGRRLLDPLAELVKIDPKSIGVGQYQHDVDQTKLKEALSFTVESCVNSVGVNLNTASKELLKYVSGLGEQLAHNIVEYRHQNGAFKSRVQLLDVPRFGNKAFQQASAFLRIPESNNPLDNSAVHPERYSLVERIAKDCDCNVSELIKNKDLRYKINLTQYISDNVGMPTLLDIIDELEKPGRDPRTEVITLKFDENIKSIHDLKVGMILNGNVTNITQFGVFVDIGIHDNGLIHVSELSDKYVSSPNEIVSLNQYVKVKIKSVDIARKRIALSMKDV